MISEKYIFLYTQEWKARGFRKYKHTWYKRCRDLTLTFMIENIKEKDFYSPYVGVSLNRKMKYPYPTKYDRAWIICFQLNPFNPKYKPEFGNTMLERIKYFDSLPPAIQDEIWTESYHLEPKKAIKIAESYFEQFDTIDKVIDFIRMSPECANVNQAKFIQKIFED